MNFSKIIREILKMLRHGHDLQPVLHYACEALTRGLGASRCVVWTVVGDRLEATEEFSADRDVMFLGNAINSRESMSIVLEFLSRFSDESGSGVIAVSDILQDPSMHEDSPALAALLELADVRSRLLGQLRSRGIFSGFVDIHQSGQTREWSPSDCMEFEEVTLALSVVVQQMFDVWKISRDATDLKVMYDLSCIFSDNKDSKIALKQAASLVASHMGFERAEVYLKDKTNCSDLLIPQIDDQESQTVKLADTENPFVNAFLWDRGKMYNHLVVENPESHPVFGNEMAYLLPLKIEEQRLGVLCLWQRPSGGPTFIPQHRELGLTLAKLFAVYLHSSSSII